MSPEARREPSRQPLLRVGIDAAYGGKPVLRGLRFELARGEVLGLVAMPGICTVPSAYPRMDGFVPCIPRYHELPVEDAPA